MLIEKYLEKIHGLYPHGIEDLIFRGQSDSKYLLESSAFRRIRKEYNNDIVQGGNYSTRESIEELKKRHKEKNMSFILKTGDTYHVELQESLEESFLIYNKNLIEEAEPVTRNNPLITSDLRALAELQHFGAATCLIDFSTDIKVALWFACISNRNADGALYILETPKQITKREESLQINKFFTSKKLWSWIPPKEINNRVGIQNSIFVLGLPTLENDIPYNKISIPLSEKAILLDELEEQGIYNLTLFPDLPGFALNNAANKPVEKRKVGTYALLEYQLKERNNGEAEEILLKHSEFIDKRIVMKLIQNKGNIKEIFQNHCIDTDNIPIFLQNFIRILTHIAIIFNYQDEEPSYALRKHGKTLHKNLKK